MSAEQEHDRTETIHLIEHVPGHQPREDDPYYRHFNATHRAMKAAGKLVCAKLCGQCQGGIELHHFHVEYSEINGYDWRKFAAKHPEFKIDSEQAFYIWCESEENMLPLCKRHHTGDLGIHEIPLPLWGALSFEKDGAPPAVEVVRAKDLQTSAKAS